MLLRDISIRSILDNSLDYVCVFDREGRVLYINSSAADLMGYTPESAEGKRLEDLDIPFGSSFSFAGDLEKCLATGESFEGEMSCPLCGKFFYLEYRMGPVYDQNGEIAGSVSSFRDVTERKLAENSLAFERDRTETYLDIADVFIGVFESSGEIVLLNRKAQDLLGYSMKELQGKDYISLFVPERYRQQVRNIFAGSASGKIEGEFNENPVLTRNGEERMIRWHNAIMKDAEGRVARVICSGEDITDLVNAREEAEKSAAIYRTIFNSTGSAMAIMDEDGTISMVNDELLSMSGYSRKELIDRRWTEFLDAGEISRIRKNKLVCRIGPETVNRRQFLNLINKAGELRNIWFTVAPLEQTGQSIISLLDFTECERSRIEKITFKDNFRKSEREKDMILESMGEVLTFQDWDHRIFFANRAAREYLGLPEDEIIGRKCYQLWAHSSKPCPGCPIEKAKISGKPESGEVRCPDGTWWDSTGTLLYGEDGSCKGFLRVAREITREKKDREMALEVESKYHHLFNASGSGLVMIDKEGIIQKVNGSFEDITGLQASLVEKKVHYSSFLSSATLKDIKRYLRSGLRSGGRMSFRYECEAIVAGGRRIRIKALVAFLEKERNFIVSITDQTSLVETRWSLISSMRKLKKLNKGVVSAISKLTELKDPYTAGHQKKVAFLALAIAREMGLSRKKRELLETAALLHDVGKVDIPSEILNKPGKINDLELAIIKNHAETGYEIMKNIEFDGPVPEIIRQHHERLDGSGYPRGLEGEEILLEARILAVADVIEAMMSHRPYRPALPKEEALEEIEKKAGILYDPDVVKVSLKLFKKDNFTFCS